MGDVFSTEKRSEVMSRIRGRGNKATEVALAKLLRAEGITGWRRHLPLVGKPDFAFPKQRVVIFVDGCFWHRCPKHSNLPRNNADFWKAKLQGNVRRDRLVTKQLRAAGWHVLRVWEHQLSDAERTARRVLKALDRTEQERFCRSRPRTFA